MITTTIQQEAYDMTFKVNLEGLTTAQAHKLVNDFIFEPSPSVRLTYDNLSTYEQSKLDGLKLALQCYQNNSFLVDRTNKISQIKFLRSITNLNLLDAKQFVEYCLWDGPIPTNMPKEF